MIGPLDYTLWVLTVVLQTVAVVLAIRAKCFLKFFTLNFYLLAASAATAARYYVFLHHGFKSREYFYFYYYSDALLTVCLYFALIALFSRVFREMGASGKIRILAIAVLGVIAFISFIIVHQSRTQMPALSPPVLRAIAAKLSEILYFVGAALTYLLWGAMLKIRRTQTRIIQIVLALGVYLSANAASFALSDFFPYSGFWKVLCYIAALWLPIAWGYAFLKFPANSQLVPAQISAGAR